MINLLIFQLKDLKGNSKVIQKLTAPFAFIQIPDPNLIVLNYLPLLFLGFTLSSTFPSDAQQSKMFDVKINYRAQQAAVKEIKQSCSKNVPSLKLNAPKWWGN